MDQLLGGGIRLPPGGKRPLILLITGDPGTGKSTLALELCYHFSQKPVSKHSLYITTESDAEWAVSKANEFKWNDPVEVIHSDNTKKKTSQISVVKLADADKALAHFCGKTQKISSPAMIAMRTIASMVGIKVENEDIERAQKSRLDKKAVKHLKTNVAHSILVIDSLNVIRDTEKQADFFEKFTSFSGDEIEVVCVILDSKPNQPAYWEYASDLVFRLGWTEASNYKIRTISITKARYQPHVWGEHQLKIVVPDERNNALEKRRAHPYRDHGGIAIYPSIHFYLSAYKRETPTQFSGRLPTHLNSFDKILSEVEDGEKHVCGLPKGRCTGLIGTRGSHKSHLAYSIIVEHLARKSARALVVSLRDDEGIAKRTMERIFKNEIRTDTGKTYSPETIKEHEENNDLEILYFPPGYITPSEFFHRIFISVQKMKAQSGKKDVILLFNSLDQLSSRFPLCASEEIFIPGLIAMLNDEDITSIFIGVDEAGQPEKQYGLLSMADALISFEKAFIEKSMYLTRVKEAKIIKSDQELPKCPEIVRTTKLEIERYAGGKAAGDSGLIELIDSTQSWRYPLKSHRGLVFIPSNRVIQNLLE